LRTQFANCLGLIAFAMAVLSGLLGSVDFFGTIQTALLVLGAFYVLGLVIGEAARRIVEENVQVELAREINSQAIPGAPVQRL
jgi:hypothetical protein